MYKALSAQARQQLERDPECVAATIERGASPAMGGTLKGLFSTSAILKEEKGNVMVGKEQPRFTVHIDDCAALKDEREGRSVLLIGGKRYGVQRILRFPQLYLAELQLGSAPQALGASQKE
ncbi:MAG: hypothetical protein AAF975_02360, partial [Spirochaetota bacterium]